MTGTAPRRVLEEPKRHWWRWAVAGVAAVATITAGTIVAVNGLGERQATAEPAEQSSTTTETSVTATTCPQTARVAVDPAWSKAMKATVAEWITTREDKCVAVEVVETTSAEVASKGLGQFAGWIPEDPAWMAQAPAELKAAKPTVVGSSPLVVVNQRAAAGALGPVNAATMAGLFTSQTTWAQHGRPQWGPIKMVVPDPATSMVGTVAFAGMVDTVAPGTKITKPFNPAKVSKTMQAVAVAQQRIVEKVSAEQVVAHLASNPEDENFWNKPGPRTGITTEALVLDEGSVQAGYLPRLGSVALSVASAANQQVDELAAWLATDDGRASLAKAGVRSPGHTPARAKLDARGLTGTAPTGKPMDAATIASTRTTWAMTARRGASMLVLDASGSMAAPMPGSGMRRIDAFMQILVGSWAYWPPGMATGVMTFNAGPAPQHKSYVKLLVPLQRNDTLAWSQTDDKYLTGLQQLSVSGGTPLYQAIDKSYAHVLERYQEGMPNQVVVVTDGVSEDAAGEPKLEALLAGLEAKKDPNRPVKVHIIAMGTGTNPKALQKIASATGGKVFMARNMAECQQVAMIALGS